jgi:hypothetical protein
LKTVIHGLPDMKNDIETLLERRRLEWFRRKVAEIGELLRQLPAARREIVGNQPESDPDRLERVADKSRSLDLDEPDNTRKTCSGRVRVKGNGIISESRRAARRKCLPATSEPENKSEVPGNNIPDHQPK